MAAGSTKGAGGMRADPFSMAARRYGGCQDGHRGVWRGDALGLQVRSDPAVPRRVGGVADRIGCAGSECTPVRLAMASSSLRCYDDFRRPTFDKRIHRSWSNEVDRRSRRLEGRTTSRHEPLGTMVTYGYPDIELAAELALAARLGVGDCWRSCRNGADSPTRPWCAGRPPIGACRSTAPTAAGAAGRSERSASTSGRPTATIHRESVDDLKRCVDWLDEAGGTCLVVHPGGLSRPGPIGARARSALAARAPRAGRARRGTSGVRICVENMPPGVHPGSRMADLAELLARAGSSPAGAGPRYRPRQPHRRRRRGDPRSRPSAGDDPRPRQ